MRILVTGRDGQLSRSMLALARPGVEIVALGRPELDITQPDSVARTIKGVRPDIIVNAAAYTAVDKAEDDREAAFLVNATGAGVVAAAARAAGIPVVQISTDYVFSGESLKPYTERDAVAPLGVYGQSKRDGEVAVAAANPDHIILRTAWVYSPYGANFVKTMLRLGADRDVIKVVADQKGCPTFAPDLAEAIVAACRVALTEGSPGWRGTFHLVGEGTASWAEFATEIFRQSDALGGPHATVEPILTAQYPTRAKRPANSVLDTSLFRATFGCRLPPWQDGVARCLAALLKPA